VNNAVSGVLPAPTLGDSINPLQIWTTIGAWVWFVGVAVMLIYGVVSFVILKRKMSEAIHIESNIYEAENIKSPFVLGVLKPMIFLPIGLSGQERHYIVLHEQTHIGRRDHIVKLVAYFVLCLHWFNPLAWVAFLFMSIDMEMSCDERVLKEIGGSIRKDYSLSLLSLATKRRFVGSSPLAFGEGGIKERVSNVLNFKKRSRVVIVAAITLVAVLSTCLAANRLFLPPNEPPEINVKSGDMEIPWFVGLNRWNGNIYDRSDDFQQLMTDKTIEDLVYIQNGEQIEITFEGLAPSKVMLTEYILNDNGSVKYVIEKAYLTYYTIVNDGQVSLRSFVFTVEPNNLVSYISSSSSNDYIKGYRFVVNWYGNECEYSYIIRGN